MFQLTRPRGARRARGCRARGPGPVSTHAPARGATGRCCCFAPGSRVSTHAPARGATGVEVGVGHDARQVSTHAPARGATWRGRYPRVGYRFNSRAREGRDTTPVESVSRLFCFNSRAREGRDCLRRRGRRGRRVSTHAPARGATLTQGAQVGELLVSTHAPARGATTSPSGAACSHAFQLTRPRGARLLRAPAG